MPPKKRNSGPQKDAIKPGAEGGSQPDKKESPVLSLKKHRDKDTDFVIFCKNLRVSDVVCEQAWKLWKNIQETVNEAVVGCTELWGACLFVAVTDLEATSFTLTQLLKAVNMNKKIFAVQSELWCDSRDKMLNNREIAQSCWTLFLLAKGKALQMEDDLVISFQLLLCAMEFFIKRCSTDLVQPLYKSVISAQSTPTRTSRRSQSKAKMRPPEPELDAQLLETLSKRMNATLKRMYIRQLHCFFGVIDLSKSADYLRAQVEKTPKKMQEESLAAMTSIQQLRGDLVSNGDRPSTNLNTYFKNCTVDPTQNVLKRLETLGQTFSQRFSEAVGPRFISTGKQRYTLGVRLYYKVMEAMLKSEEKRLSVQNFSKLLNDSKFHTSLLACAWRLSWQHMERAVLAFDFYKVIESFIKAEPTLNKDIVKHLETCENLIMEKIAWLPGSPLFELLKHEQEAGSTEMSVETTANLNQPLQHNHTAADLYLSPLRPGVRVLPAETPLPSNVYRLAYTRLKTLCSYLLSFPPELEPIIWTLFQHTLQHEYELMKNRHLDQLMMSAMYAIAKVKCADLRFKTIVTAYKNMPNTKQETFKQVLISEGNYDSIIVFYNQVFMQKLKTNILQYASPRPPTLSPIPQIPKSPYKFPNSPLRVPGSNNVYISPMKSTRMSPGIMTPRSRMLVSIGESFGLSNRFQKINQMVNSSDRSYKRTLDLGPSLKPLKRLRFDVDGQDEADGSKSSGESTLIQKLAEMSSTRSRMQEQKMKEDAGSKQD
ncbi:hypothetical protein WMY93_007883 [Mugilogobius chulae]|uniref:Retinoblastoma 1 n=1 Tax=Mugilogobius chulae TaxID=88201 RepID=A0AAW0PN36_9GOBI